MPVTLIWHSVLVAVFAVVFTEILMDEDMIFGWWCKVLNRLPEKIKMPLGGCAYCFGGQIALWYYFLIDKYSVFHHTFFIVLTIFFIHLTLFVYERTQ